MKIPKNVFESKGIAFIEKFPYQEISKVSKNKKRHYETPDGRQVPSVTTVLSATKDMTHLNAWKKRVGEQKAQQIATESANIGTVMHRSLEKHVKGEDRTPGSNLIQQKAHAMANVIIENGLKDVSEVWGSEVSLYYPELYAGTTDLVGIYKDQPFIGDFKQARKLKKKEWVEDYYLQIAAYAMAHDYVHGSKIRQGVIMMCTPDLYYQEFRITDHELRSYKHKFLKRLDMYHDLIFDEKEKADVKIEAGDFTRNK